MKPIYDGSPIQSALTVFEAAISYSDNGKLLFTLPANAKIYSMQIDVTTGFNGTSPTYGAGTSASANELFTGLSLSSSAGRNTQPTPSSSTVGAWVNGVGASTKIYGKFSGGGSNTAGAGVLRIAFYV